MVIDFIFLLFEEKNGQKDSFSKQCFQQITVPIKVINFISSTSKTLKMSRQARFKLNLTIIFFAFILYPVFTDAESGFSQGCYSSCPRKIWTLETNSREQVDREWIQCLKQCHQFNSWKFIIIVGGVILIIAIISILAYVCWGEMIRLKYTFHVQRKKRCAILTEDQTKIKVFEQGLIKFKQIMIEYREQIQIEFQNDSGYKKRFLVKNAIFDQLKTNSLQNMFSIILFRKKQNLSPQINNNRSEFQEQSQIQIKSETTNDNLENLEYSQLLGALSLTSKGLNLWWIKIDQKPVDPNAWCKICSRKDKKYFAVYEKDPFAPQGSFIGNVVLQDSSKQAEERYAKYIIKKKDCSLTSIYQLNGIKT